MAHSSQALEADRALIQDLGGVAELARKLNTSVQVVSNWNRRGIPAAVKLDHPDLFLSHLARKPAKAGA